MNRSPFTQATSRLGPGLKAVLGVIGVVGLLEALLVKWVGMEAIRSLLVCTTDGIAHWQLWRLLTAGVLTDITQPMGLVFTLAGLFFLSPDLEKRWGTRRFLLFLATSTVLGNLLGVGLDRVAPESLRLLHPPMFFGAGAALTGTAIAWGIHHREDQILLFMVLPVRGQTLIWITIAGCFLYLLYLGDMTGFGGVITGLTMVGEPSAARRAYLGVKLALLRGRYDQHDAPFSGAGSVRGKGPRSGRGDRPPLRVVQGGQPDERERGERDHPREPPKDKRYLN